MPFPLSGVSKQSDPNDASQTVGKLDGKDEDEREKVMLEHIIKRDITNNNKVELENDDDNDPVDHQILAEESKLVPRRRPSDAYLERDVKI